MIILIGVFLLCTLWSDLFASNPDKKQLAVQSSNSQGIGLNGKPINISPLTSPFSRRIGDNAVLRTATSKYSTSSEKQEFENQSESVSEEEFLPDLTTLNELLTSTNLENQNPPHRSSFSRPLFYLFFIGLGGTIFVDCALNKARYTQQCIQSLLHTARTHLAWTATIATATICALFYWLNTQKKQDEYSTIPPGLLQHFLEIQQVAIQQQEQSLSQQEEMIITNHDNIQQQNDEDSADETNRNKNNEQSNLSQVLTLNKDSAEEQTSADMQSRDDQSEEKTPTPMQLPTPEVPPSVNSKIPDLLTKPRTTQPRIIVNTLGLLNSYAHNSITTHLEKLIICSKETLTKIDKNIWTGASLNTQMLGLAYSKNDPNNIIAITGSPKSPENSSDQNITHDLQLTENPLFDKIKFALSTSLGTFSQLQLRRSDEQGKRTFSEHLSKDPSLQNFLDQYDWTILCNEGATPSTCGNFYCSQDETVTRWDIPKASQALCFINNSDQLTTIKKYKKPGEDIVGLVVYKKNPQKKKKNTHKAPLSIGIALITTIHNRLNSVESTIQLPQNASDNLKNSIQKHTSVLKKLANNQPLTLRVINNSKLAKDLLASEQSNTRIKEYVTDGLMWAYDPACGNFDLIDAILHKRHEEIEHKKIEQEEETDIQPPTDIIQDLRNRITGYMSAALSYPSSEVKAFIDLAEQLRKNRNLAEHYQKEEAFQKYVLNKFRNILTSLESSSPSNPTSPIFIQVIQQNPHLLSQTTKKEKDKILQDYYHRTDNNVWINQRLCDYLQGIMTSIKERRKKIAPAGHTLHGIVVTKYGGTINWAIVVNKLEKSSLQRADAFNKFAQTLDQNLCVTKSIPFDTALKEGETLIYTLKQRLPKGNIDKTLDPSISKALKKSTLSPNEFFEQYCDEGEWMYLRFNGNSFTYESSSSPLTYPKSFENDLYNLLICKKAIDPNVLGIIVTPDKKLYISQHTRQTNNNCALNPNKLSSVFQENFKAYEKYLCLLTSPFSVLTGTEVTLEHKQASTEVQKNFNEFLQKHPDFAFKVENNVDNIFFVDKKTDGKNTLESFYLFKTVTFLESSETEGAL